MHHVPMFVCSSVGTIKHGTFENFKRRSVSPNPINWWAFFANPTIRDCKSSKIFGVVEQPEHYLYNGGDLVIVRLPNT